MVEKQQKISFSSIKKVSPPRLLTAGAAGFSVLILKVKEKKIIEATVLAGSNKIMPRQDLLADFN